MSKSSSAFRLKLTGPFRLSGPDGARIDVSSKRGQALIAMLATSGGGERTRSWLQDRLWGSRAPEQAQASLRRELSNLRQLVNRSGAMLLHSDRSRVWLDLSMIDADVRNLDSAAQDEFLDGVDIAGEEDFEDWLREERARIFNRPVVAVVVPAADHQNRATGEFADRPAIAVLPFMWLPHTAENELIAHGISEDLIDRLSRLRWLPVIARSSSFAIAAETRDARAVGVSLGARYVVDGAIREEAGGRSLTASLCDAQNGQTLWSSKIVLPADAGFGALSDLLDNITATLDIKIDNLEQVNSLRKPQSDLNVTELIWRGRWHLHRLTKNDARLARECFDEAYAREPNSPEALIQYTWVRFWEQWADRASSQQVRELRQLAQQAIIADYDDARGHMMAGIAEIWLRQPLRAEALLQRAIELNPSLVMAHGQLGCALHLKSDHQAALDRLGFTIRLSPNDQDLFFFEGERACAHLMLGDFEQALAHNEYSLLRRPGYWRAHVGKVNALARLGRKVEARAAHAELMSAKVAFRLEYVDWIPFIDSSLNIYLQDGLNLATADDD